LDKLDQDAVSAVGMNECHPMSAKADPGSFVNELHSLGFQLRQGLTHIGHAQGDVMQPFPAPVEKLRDGAVGAGGLKQLELRIAQREHTDLDVELWDDAALAGGKPQERQRLERRVYILDGDADVIEGEA
jgi:hypothetical protein